MTAASDALAPGRPEPPDHDLPENTRPALGDTLIIDGAGMAGLPLLGTIVAIIGDNGAPPYLVHWTAGDYDARVVPGAGSHIEKHP